MKNLVEAIGWRVAHQETLPGRPPEHFQVPEDGQLHPLVRRYLSKAAPNGIYGHQLQAILSILSGQHTCMATGTASGKSLPFYASGIQTLVSDSNARIIAIYPLKALATEQEDRWRIALSEVGYGPEAVGRIDGSVSSTQREAILKRARVVLFTPDVIHAWLLGNLTSKVVRRFLTSLQLIVVDEIHVYTGVFGSNAAYLFRRLRHAAAHLAGAEKVRFLAASATVADAEKHLSKLFGASFHLIAAAADTSPRFERELLMVRPPGDRDMVSEIVELLQHVVRQGEDRFIAFVDSRRQAEQFATILRREAAGHEPAEDDTAVSHERGTGDASVLPYRSGYEEHDRAEILARLARRDLRGVISTSALELGLDISGLDLVILIGVPQTMTSLQQRIGRVGRHGPGRILIVDAGGVTDGVVFKAPHELFHRPLAPAALHLENKRIQYIHALCFAGIGGEEAVLSSDGEEGLDPEIGSPITWPEGFLSLCAKERTGGSPQSCIL